MDLQIVIRLDIVVPLNNLKRGSTNITAQGEERE